MRTVAMQPEPERRALPRHLGLSGAVALGVGGTLGGGIFVLIGIAVQAAGAGAWLAFVLGLGLVALIALPYTEVATRAPRAGGGYAFVQATMGSRWGFFMGWGYAAAWLLGSGYVTTGFGRYLHALTGIPALPAMLVLIAACTFLNVFGIGPTARVQAILMSVTVLGLGAFVLIGAAHVSIPRLSPVLSRGPHGVLFATVLAFLALNGFDAIAAASEEMPDPSRTVPRAIALTLLIVGGLYIAVAVVAVGTTPLPTLAHSSAPLADATAHLGGHTFRALLLLVAVLTIAATANAMIVVSSRVMFGMARDGHLPAGLGRLSRRRGAPVASVLLSGGIVALVGLVAYAGAIRLIAGSAGLLYILHYLPALIGLARAHRQPPTVATGAFSTPAARVVLPAAIGFAGLIALASGGPAIATSAGWLMLGHLYRRTFAQRRRVRRNASPTGGTAGNPLTPSNTIEPLD
jgi:basic amino acid/polyamine antiporter, APA family